MAVEAWKCAVPNCKGHVVFDNADIDFSGVKTIYGVHAYVARNFGEPRCVECGKEHLVVPSYTVITEKEDGDFVQATSTCITEYEKRKREIDFENKTGY